MPFSYIYFVKCGPWQVCWQVCASHFSNAWLFVTSLLQSIVYAVLNGCWRFRLTTMLSNWYYRVNGVEISSNLYHRVNDNKKIPRCTVRILKKTMCSRKVIFVYMMVLFIRYLANFVCHNIFIYIGYCTLFQGSYSTSGRHTSNCVVL